MPLIIKVTESKFSMNKFDGSVQHHLIITENVITGIKIAISILIVC